MQHQSVTFKKIRYATSTFEYSNCPTNNKYPTTNVITATKFSKVQQAAVETSALLALLMFNSRPPAMHRGHLLAYQMSTAEINSNDVRKLHT